MLFRYVVFSFGMSIALGGLVRAEIKPDFLMDSDPEFRMADPIPNFTRDFKGTWIQALERPETDLQRMAAESIAIAHKKGIPGLTESVPALEKILTADNSHPAARFAAARALISLDSRRSAEKLFQISQAYGTDLRQLVEPIMAEWEVAAAKSVWVGRLTTPKVRTRELILALRGLAHVREVSALPSILKLTVDLVQPANIRLEAAAAAGQLADSGLEQDAERLSHESRTDPVVNRHCAIQLLTRHANDTARQLLLELATDTEPSIAAAALQRLNAIDPALVLPLAETAIKSLDQHVREQGANAYLSLPTPARIESLSMLLNDPHPKIRKRICEEFVRLSQTAELDESIRTSSTEMLAGEQWRGQEQAALVLGTLEHKPAAKRLVELLESSRSEVLVASAWGLRKVAVPETIPALLDKASRQKKAKEKDTNPALEFQIAHLFEACGRMRAKEGEAAMIEYIPKLVALGDRPRGAAIWALGWIHEGTPDESLCGMLSGRVTDVGIYPPETFLVKRMSIVSLVRMNAVNHAPAIKSMVPHGIPSSTLGLAHQWALKKLTGEELPDPAPLFLRQGNWFLEPLP